MGEWKIHIYRKDVYLAFCSWHFETSQISNPATNKATVRCLRDMLMFLFHLCWSKRYSSCTYRRGLLRCSFGQGGQCEGLKVQDE